MLSEGGAIPQGRACTYTNKWGMLTCCTRVTMRPGTTRMVLNTGGSEEGGLWMPCDSRAMFSALPEGNYSFAARLAGSASALEQQAAANFSIICQAPNLQARAAL